MAGVALLHTKILHSQPPDRSGHPAVLVAMIMNAAELPDLPANGHALKYVVLENQVACVIAAGEEEIFVQGFRTNGVLHDVVLDGFQGELALRDGGEVLHPIRDGQLLAFHSCLFVHRGPRRLGNAGPSFNYSTASSISFDRRMRREKEKQIHPKSETKKKKPHSIKTFSENTTN